MLFSSIHMARFASVGFRVDSQGMGLTFTGCKSLMKDDDRREIVNRLIESQKRTGWPVQSLTAKLKSHWSKAERFSAIS